MFYIISKQITSQCLRDNLQLSYFQRALKRNFFSKSKRREFKDRKLIGFSSEQMYSVVSDVKNYYNFVPFCTKSLIISERQDFLKANLEVGFPPIRENYTSHVTLIRPQLVKAICTDGKLFNYLENKWKFAPGLESNPQTCIIDFSIDFEFKSFLHSQLANMFFDQLVKQMEKAFFLEAKRRYGKESVPIHPLNLVKS